MSKLAERLAKKIKDELNIDVEPVIRRNYGAYAYRADGVSMWHMKELSPNKMSTLAYGIGSAYRASECVKSKNRLCEGLSDLSGMQIELEEL